MIKIANNGHSRIRVKSGTLDHDSGVVREPAMGRSRHGVYGCGVVTNVDEVGGDLMENGLWVVSLHYREESGKTPGGILAPGLHDGHVLGAGLGLNG